MDNSPILPVRLTAKKGMFETISQLAHRHLYDPLHTTSDEELLYAKVELSGSSDSDYENSYQTTTPHVLTPFPSGSDYTDGGKSKSTSQYNATQALQG